jgi:hypothetical protein
MYMLHFAQAIAIEGYCGREEQSFLLIQLRSKKLQYAAQQIF